MAIDGADQIAPDGWLVKGGGAAHTREKIVAAAADRFVVIADSSKPVAHLHPPIPLELLAFGLAATLRHLGAASLRDVPPSPDGGVIADFTGEVGDPAELAARLSATPGVVAHGLFPPRAGRDGARRPGHDGGADGFPALSRPRRHRILRCRPRRRRPATSDASASTRPAGMEVSPASSFASGPACPPR